MCVCGGKESYNVLRYFWRPTIILVRINNICTKMVIPNVDRNISMYMVIRPKFIFYLFRFFLNSSKQTLTVPNFILAVERNFRKMEYIVFATHIHFISRIELLCN